MRRSLALFAFVGACSIVSPPVHPADKAGHSPEQIAALVAQLGDRSFRVRQAAGKALEEIGEPALPALRDAFKSPDEEIRRRAEVLCQHIEHTALLSPKRVNLTFKNRPLEEVVNELARQTGYKLQYQGGNNRKVSIDLQDVTYWEALEKICDDGQLSPGFDDQQGVVYLYHQDVHSPFTHHAGPFRIVAQNFNYSRHVNLANIPRNRVDPNANGFDNSLVFGFLIQAEPKVPILMVGQPKLTKAEDENGVSLLPQAVQGQHEVHFYDGGGMYRNYQHSTGVGMSKPAKDATAAKVIKGKVPVVLLAGTRPDVVVEKLEVGNKKVSAVGRSAEIDVESVGEANKNYTVTMVVKRRLKQGEQPDYNWMNSIPQKLELYDDKGRKFNSHGVTNFINQTPGSVHATYQFGPPSGTEMGTATKLVLAEWLTVTHELEFEFKDLPLP